ncbi:hypothetical protein AVEN_224366-1 [Araneus ventricosus]|uniref:Uncharacterized protein n=1 Tax=Araneus ventricosus TaxID=182803 RepID=A0A4Y2ME31_ARAVE|nr:hypothetical protein AVEN_224366-1 [Araneus ventricosus]
MSSSFEIRGQSVSSSIATRIFEETCRLGRCPLRLVRVEVSLVGATPDVEEVSAPGGVLFIWSKVKCLSSSVQHGCLKKKTCRTVSSSFWSGRSVFSSVQHGYLKRDVSAEAVSRFSP